MYVHGRATYATENTTKSRRIKVFKTGVSADGEAAGADDAEDARVAEDDDDTGEEEAQQEEELLRRLA